MLIQTDGTPVIPDVGNPYMEGVNEYGDEDLVIGKLGSSSTLSPVPIPAAVWLLGSGLLGLIGIRRRKQ
jgi:hypothetical protein